jgi:CRISPR-associated endonuclease/helicase Cas3
MPVPRPVQQAVVALAGPRAGSPGLLIVEAPMGEGKTEAAFWWAAACQSATCCGVYLALPTQATSNAMLPRLRQLLEGVSPGGIAPSIRLIHGAAALQLDQSNGHLTPNTPGTDDRRAAIDAEGWFTPRKRTLWATYAVGTVDQALLAALAVKHGFVRLAGLATKAVVIDEVHAYDVYMTSILERLLRWLAVLGTPVALLSATLPANRRARLIAAYTGTDPIEPPTSYPLVTVADPSGHVEWVEPAASSRRVDVAVERWQDAGDDPLALDRLAANLCARVAGGGCFAWIHNTVDAAQRAFRALRRLLDERPDPPIDLWLFHARFRFVDRQRIESEIVKRFGPGGNRPARAIVVATQVIEQSLDLDFDLMASMMAPVDLLLQRLGRVWRHATTSRPAGCFGPRLILLTPPVADRRPRFGATEHIYERFILLKTLLGLDGRTTIRLPADIRGLVEEVYDELIPTPDRAAAAGLDPDDLERAWAALETQRSGDRKEAAQRLLAPPDPVDPFYEAMDNVLFEETDEETATDRWIAAVTRLGPPSRNVILLHRRGGKLYLDADAGTPLDLDRPLAPAVQRELMRRSVVLARREVVRALEAFEPPPGMQECPALRHHAVLALEQRQHRLSDSALTIKLDPELGVVYERNSVSRQDAPPMNETTR